MRISKQNEHLAYEEHYFVHNGFSGHSYGTPQNPVRISLEDARVILSFLKIRGGNDQDSECRFSVQYADEGDEKFEATNGNRFLYFGRVGECIVEDENLVAEEHPIDRTKFIENES